MMRKASLGTILFTVFLDLLDIREVAPDRFDFADRQAELWIEWIKGADTVVVPMTRSVR